MFRWFVVCFVAGALTLSAQTPRKIKDADVYVLDMQYANSSYQFSNVANVSGRHGGDDLPCFSPDGKTIFYSVQEGKQRDIYRYDIATKKSTPLAKTAENECEPRVTPDGKFVSVVRTDKKDVQRVWKCPIDGGNYQVVTNRLDSIDGQEWWVDDYLVLHYYKKPAFLGCVNMRHGREHFLSDVAMRCIQNIPTETSLSFYAGPAPKDSAGTIRKITEFFEISIIAPALPGSQDFVWTKRKTVLMASGSKLYEYDFAPNARWIEVADLSILGLKKITRLALDKDNNHLAVVCER